MTLVHDNRSFLFIGLLLGGVFIALLSVRLGLWEGSTLPTQPIDSNAVYTVDSHESWMEVLQKGRKIGYSHNRLQKSTHGYSWHEEVFLRLNVLGMLREIQWHTLGELNADFTLRSFKMDLHSGPFAFHVSGALENGILTVNTAGMGVDKSDSRKMEIPVNQALFMAGAALHNILVRKLKSGDRFTMEVFDPTVMAITPLAIEVLGQEEIEWSGQSQATTKLAMTFKGATQLVWISPSGDILRESGLLGIQLDKTTREQARVGIAAEAGEDLVAAASVISNKPFDAPEDLSRLRVRLGGFEVPSLAIEGGRQQWRDGVLTIEKEILPGSSSDMKFTTFPEEAERFLRAEPFIQSDHEAIVRLVHKITRESQTPVQKARELIDWVFQNIAKRPVLSVPDALTTLEQRAGDCNEHAVLLAALARAAGIPAKIEAGLSYLNGRFYFHAWNLLYVGQWITADAVLGQMPADVTHIRLVSGGPEKQLDLLGVIGKVQLEVVE